MRPRHAASALALAVVVTVVSAPPAAAHNAAGGLEATNYLTRLKSVSPRVPGVAVRVIEFGNRLELRNETDREVTVPGYQDEPYLRIGPDGVFENLNSQATYLNASRFQPETPPPAARPGAAPKWRKVSSEPVARWHDHRAHWMLDDPPPAVRRDPGRRHVIFDKWEVPFQHGSRDVVATGDLVWVPGPSATPYWILAAALLVVAFVVALSRVSAGGVAALLVVLVAADVVHAVGVQWAGEFSLGSRFARLFSAGLYSVLGWIAGAIGIWMLARRRMDGLLAAAVAGLLAAMFGGVVDVGDLTRSQIPFAFDAAIARLTIAVTLGLGVGLLVGSLIALRRLPPDGDDEEATVEASADFTS